MNARVSFTKKINGKTNTVKLRNEWDKRGKLQWETAIDMHEIDNWIKLVRTIDSKGRYPFICLGVAPADKGKWDNKTVKNIKHFRSHYILCEIQLNNHLHVHKFCILYTGVCNYILRRKHMMIPPQLVLRTVLAYSGIMISIIICFSF